MSNVHLFFFENRGDDSCHRHITAFGHVFQMVAADPVNKGTENSHVRPAVQWFVEDLQHTILGLGMNHMRNIDPQLLQDLGEFSMVIDLFGCRLGKKHLIFSCGSV